jgi:hypothetical protein
LTNPEAKAMAETLDVMEALLSAGEELDPTVRAEILQQGARAVPRLVAIVEDDSLAEVDAPGGGWAPIHAVDLLAELKAEEAIRPMLRLLRATSFDDIIHDRLILALAKMGPPALEPVLEAHAATEDPERRYELCDILSSLGVKDDRIYRALLALFDEHIAAGAMYLAVYGDPAALPILSAALDDEPDIPSDNPAENHTVIELAEAIDTLGGSLSASQWHKRTRVIQVARRKYRERAAVEREPEPAPPAKRKLGRNDPCWCGSGKKYKKCHLQSDEREPS